jgi:hypothetical protein
MRAAEDRAHVLEERALDRRLWSNRGRKQGSGVEPAIDESVSIVRIASVEEHRTLAIELEQLGRQARLPRRPSFLG